MILNQYLSSTIIPYQELLVIGLLHFTAPLCLETVLESYGFRLNEGKKESNVATMFDALIKDKKPLASINYFSTRDYPWKSSRN
jgi:hypothetical protein